MSLTGAPDAVRVNWAELTLTNSPGKVVYGNAFVINHLITPQNVVDLVRAGRYRWKTENEHLNTLKTKAIISSTTLATETPASLRRCCR